MRRWLIGLLFVPMMACHVDDRAGGWRGMKLRACQTIVDQQVRAQCIESVK